MARIIRETHAIRGIGATVARISFSVQWVLVTLTSDGPSANKTIDVGHDKRGNLSFC